jgi:hypothetical protein
LKGEEVLCPVYREEQKSEEKILFSIVLPRIYYNVNFIFSLFSFRGALHAHLCAAFAIQEINPTSNTILVDAVKVIVSFWSNVSKRINKVRFGVEGCITNKLFVDVDNKSRAK